MSTDSPPATEQTPAAYEDQYGKPLKWALIESSSTADSQPLIV